MTDGALKVVLIKAIKEVRGVPAYRSIRVKI